MRNLCFFKLQDVCVPWLPMYFVDGFLLVLVLVVSALIARGSDPAARIVLFGSALLISAALFLPSSLLSAMVGSDGLALLESMASKFSWTLANAAHFIAFAWLALVLWTLQPDLRGWRVITGLMVLAGAAELLQGLTVDRSARMADVAVNMSGAGIGVALAIMGTRLWNIARPDRTGDP